MFAKRRVDGFLCLQTKVLFCSPDAKGLSPVLLQSSSWDDFVTVWLLAPHMNLMVSPTDALRAKGTYRRTPCVGATMTVWVLPLPELPESEVDEGGGMYMFDGLPNWATHSVTSQITTSKQGRKETYVAHSCHNRLCSSLKNQSHMRGVTLTMTCRRNRSRNCCYPRCGQGERQKSSSFCRQNHNCCRNCRCRYPMSS